MNDKILMLHFAGQTTPEQEHELQAWRRAHSDHERRYRQTGALLHAAEEADQGWRDRTPPAASEVIRFAERSVTPTAQRRPMSQPGSWRRYLLRGLGAAAMIGIGVGISSAFDALRPSSFGVEEFVTGPTETVTVSLKDGSVVRLAPDSRLRVLARSGARQVSLSGRAFFAIAKRAGQQFRIQAGSGEVTVLGTRFDLETKGEDLRVVVVDGTVTLSAPRGETRVTGGQMGRLIRGVPVPPVLVPDVASIVDWTGNFLAFQESPLAQVARELERRFRTRVTIEETGLRQQTFTGWFSGWTLEQVLEVICAASNAECSTQDGTVNIRSR